MTDPGSFETPCGHDGDGDVCAICLATLCSSDKAKIDGCAHEFCFVCICKWSEVTNVCPLCKTAFAIIERFQHGVVTGTAHASPKQPKHDELEPEWAECLCEVCGSGHDEHLLLLCDACDLPYHAGCLAPPLDTVPDGDWFCPECDSDARHHDKPDEDSGSRRTALRSILSSSDDDDSDSPVMSRRPAQQRDRGRRRLLRGGGTTQARPLAARRTRAPGPAPGAGWLQRPSATRFRAPRGHALRADSDSEPDSRGRARRDGYERDGFVVSDSEGDSDGPWQHLPKNNSKRPLSSDEDEDEAFANPFTQTFRIHPRARPRLQKFVRRSLPAATSQASAAIGSRFDYTPAAARSPEPIHNRHASAASSKPPMASESGWLSRPASALPQSQPSTRNNNPPTSNPRPQSSSPPSFYIQSNARGGSKPDLRQFAFSIKR